jgi:predicted DNA-binding transcriptional regulator AlpA
MTTRFLPISEVLERLPVCRETLRAMIAREECPSPVRISKGRVMFPADAWEAWERSRPSVTPRAAKETI